MTHIIRIHCSTEKYAQKYQLSGIHVENTPINWPKDSQKYDIYITEEGLRKLEVTSQQPKAVLLGEELGIIVYKHKYMSKENDSIAFIMGTFDGEEMVRQFPIG